MWNVPSKTILDRIPKLYATEKTPIMKKVIYLHFFIFGSDWFVAEFDGEDLFFGFAILNDDKQNAEWGYVSFSELRSIRVSGVEIDRDLHWDVRPVKEVARIMACRR